ncbi:MAG: tetratricopeptide repeat protein [Bacteroidales bacterium]|nr:tetratricopeptide repeat protein [Bacteroidales bacterium]
MKKAILTAIAVLGMSMVAGAQSKITDQNLVHDGKDAIVTFNIETDHNSIPSKRKEVIMPYIYNGKDTLWLETVEVYGKNRYKRERQENHLDGNKGWELEEGQVIKGEVYSYRDTAPLKRWMAPANLGIRREIVGCACEDELADEEVASATLFQEPPVEPRRIPKAYALADATREWNFGQDELEIIFKVSKIEIDSSVFNNEVTFGKILSAVDKIYSNPKFRVDKIEIAGYASPEGRRSFNNWLGQNRAKALIDYIIENRPQYNLTADNFRLRNGEENWPGLRRLLMESRIAEKDQVVEIIDMEIPDEEKKLKIMAIDNGKVWKKMLDQVYPHLRSARYLAVYYDSTQDEAVDVINQANRMIGEGRYAEAYEHVKPYDDDFRAYNTIGVALMMQGEFEKALPWFEKALENEFKEAQENIDAIDAELQYEEQKRKEREEYLKRFE